MSSPYNRKLHSKKKKKKKVFSRLTYDRHEYYPELCCGIYLSLLSPLLLDILSFSIRSLIKAVITQRVASRRKTGRRKKKVR